MEIAIDAGRKRSYVVVQNGRRIEREMYVETTQEGFDSIIPKTGGNTFILEAGITLYPIVGILETYPESKIIVAHPAAMKLIAKSPNKTDKNDAHKLLEAYNADYLPRSYLPTKEIRNDRNLCSARDFIVRQRAAIKNRIRYEGFRCGYDFGRAITKRTFNSLQNSNYLNLKEMAGLHEMYSEHISVFDDKVKERASQSRYAVLIDTIPGIGTISALSIASQIGDINRFRTEFHFFSYAGLCPSIRQSGSKEWKGHIKSGNVSLRNLLIECVWMHISHCHDSAITDSYYKLAKRMGAKKAAVASAKRLARIIYFMLIRDEPFKPYGVGR